MEDMIRGVKAKLEEIVPVLSLLKERIDKLCDTSPCEGDICSCLTFYKGTEAQLKDVLQQFKQKDHEDKVRDKKLEQLSQEIANMRAGEIATTSRTVFSKTNFRKERADLGRQKKTSTFPNKSFKTGSKNDNESYGERKEGNSIRQTSHEQRSDDQHSYSEDETHDKTVNFETKTKKKHDQHVQHKLNPNQDNEYFSKLKLPKDDDTSHGNILQPNFKKTTALRQTGASATMSTSDPTQTNDGLPEVVEQREKEYYLTAGVWDVEAKAEEISSQRTALRKLEAVTTILLIDTSQSMATGDTWRQVKTFVKDYIDGLEEMSSKHQSIEHVALVTFGAQTRCHQRYTNDFNLIRAAFDKLQLGGPSPLYGGLTMADSVSLTCEKDLISLGNGMLVYTKIILITDGEPTEVCLHRGPDIPDPKKMDETMTLLIALMQAMTSKCLDLFCIPVGNANREYLNLLFSKEGGRRFLNYRDGRYFSRRLFLTTKFEVRRNLFFGIKYEIPRHDPELTAQDLAHMQEILDDANAKSYEDMKRKEQNQYEERNNIRLLPVGSRVRRGPDWTNGVEDDEGPGTVVGHNLYCDKIWVNWDKTDELRQYSFGDLDMYAVLPVDEPRIPLPGQPLAVGCVVTTGNDWKDDMVSAGSRGVIIKMGSTQSGIRKALVRWQNGKKGVHSYGDDKIYEIILCMTDTSLPAIPSTQSVPAIEYHHQRPAIQNRQPDNPAVNYINRDSSRRSQSQHKNKNKNVN